MLFVAFVAAPAAAAERPEPGRWAGPPAVGSGARAVVRLTVDDGSRLVQPVVRYRLRRCGGRPFSQRVSLGLVATRGRRFEVLSRHRVGRTRVRLRLVGRFDSSYEAHGAVHGRVVLRNRSCRLPRLAWTAEQGWTPSDADEDLDEIPDEELEDGEELEEDDFDEDGEPIEDEDEIPVEDEDPGDGDQDPPDGP